MSDERPVSEEALKGMIKALDDFILDTNAVINSLQQDANECADNMNGDMVSAKAIMKVNKCIGYYRQINDRASDLQEKMKNKLTSLQALQAIMNGMDD